MKKHPIGQYMVIGLAAAFFLVLSVGTALKPDIAFSPNENRMLEERPEATARSVLSGEFSEDSETYLTDQIVGREMWVELKGQVERTLGVTDMNGVYLCRDGRLVERVTEADFPRARYEKNLEEVVKLREILTAQKGGSGIPVRLLLAPTAASIYADDLPPHALTFDEEAAYREAQERLGADLVDVRPILRVATTAGETYFHTDHHWTGYGAYAGSLAYLHVRDGGDGSPAAVAAQAGSMLTGTAQTAATQAGTGQTAAAQTGTGAYEEAGEAQALHAAYLENGPEVLSDEFYGTLYSKVLLPVQPDTIETPRAARQATYSVKMEDETYDSLYFTEKLAEKDKYAVYFGGNYARVDIELADSSVRGEGERLLLIKDSYANSFVPFLIPGPFSRITMIDTRYYRENIAELAADYDEVLVLYSVNNFAAEALHLTQAVLQ